ncbi:MAG: twitching motility protein PilT [Myxococcales bacterium]|nr:twitching motility protein PilT [Myxococcales bacterium]
MRFLLDTDTCLYAIRKHTRVLDRIASHRRPDVAISVITECELRFGAAKSGAPTRMFRTLEAFLLPLEILEFTSADAVAYAEVRATLERAGTPMGPLDTLIAAHARAQSLVLVTNNEREFRRVAGLRVENWTN